ncbi:MAG: GHKL domain-containing protein [Candidatus Goldbacteria bacterium]|nr:GHKL domain-containing protein [Candidatus Goldiibacteriota bacterium]
MTIWSTIHFFCFLIYILLFSYILGKNSKSYLNWYAALLIACFSLWSLGNSMIFSDFSTVENAKPMLLISAPGWIFFSSVYLLFIFEFTESKLSRSPFILFLVLIIPAILFVAYLNGQITQCCDKTYYGLTSRWLNTPWTNLFYAYYVSFFLLGIYFLLRFILQGKNPYKKNTAIILMVAMLFCFITGTISSVVLKVTKKYVPIEANVYLLVFAAGIIYSMYRYEFLSITPTKAADLIINTMNDAFILLDKKGKILNLNRAAFELFECNKKNNEDCIQILPEYLLQKIIKDVWKKGNILNEEIIINTIKDNKKTALLSVNILKNKKETLGYVCILKDITELKLAKSELEETVNKLMKVNKELEQFAYVISHDIKEPLRMVSSYVQLLQKKYQDKLDADANDYIRFAVDGVKRMNDLIDGLLDYSRVLTRDMTIEDVDVKQVIEEILSILKFKIEEKKATIMIKTDLPVVEANKINIMRVFQNLIDNALKFCKNKPVIEITSEKKGKFYFFCIKDNGIGINNENKDGIFKIFHRINPREEYEGTGIGLSICKKIIERHNGKIWFESEGDGKGSAFYFTLPA